MSTQHVRLHLNFVIRLFTNHLNCSTVKFPPYLQVPIQYSIAAYTRHQRRQRSKMIGLLCGSNRSSVILFLDSRVTHFSSEGLVSNSKKSIYLPSI